MEKMTYEQYINLSEMMDLSDQADIDLAEEIFCNMNINDISYFLFYRGKGNYRNNLPMKSFNHLLKLSQSGSR